VRFRGESSSQTVLSHVMDDHASGAALVIGLKANLKIYFVDKEVPVALRTEAKFRSTRPSATSQCPAGVGMVCLWRGAAGRTPALVGLDDATTLPLTLIIGPLLD
jgi:hypothetical protein